MLNNAWIIRIAPFRTGKISGKHVHSLLIVCLYTHAYTYTLDLDICTCTELAF